MSDAEDVLNKDPCADLLRLANICVQTSNIGAGCEECFNAQTFGEAFPRDISQQFLSAMGFVPQFDPGFCEVAQQRVCDNYNANQACCCEEETAAFRVCAFNKVLMPQVGWAEGQCTDNCGQRLSVEDSTDSGGGSMGLIAALVVVILLLLGAGGFIVYRRRKNHNYGLPTSVHIMDKKGYEGEDTHIVNSSQSDEDIIPDVENPSPRTERIMSRKVPRNVSNIVEHDDDDNSSSSASIAAFEPPSPVTSKRVLRRPESEDDEEPKLVKKGSKLDVLKEKRKAIEAWNTEKKQGSQRSLSSFIPDEDPEAKNDGTPVMPRSSSNRHNNTVKKQGSRPPRSHSLSFISGEDHESGKKDTAPRMPRSCSNRELSTSDAPRSSSDIRKERKEMDSMINQLKTTRKGLLERVNQLKEYTNEGEANDISSRQMHGLMKDRAESTLRLSQLDDALKHYQHRVYALEAEAKAVRKDQKSKDTAKLSMSTSALASDFDNNLADGKMNEKSDRRPKKPSSGNHISPRSEREPSLKEKQVKKEGSSRNLARQISNTSPVEKRERRKSGSNLARQNSDTSLVEKRERRKSGSNLSGQNSDSSLVEKRERRKSGSNNLPRQSSDSSLVDEKRERRKSGSSKDLSRSSSKKMESSRGSDY
jgi:hypothetical protein